jgi:hypothetical protein
MVRVSREVIRQDVLRRWLIAKGVEEAWQSIEEPEQRRTYVSTAK